MSKLTISYIDMGKTFVKIGASSFGGWSTTSLLLEKELVEKHKLLKSSQLKGAVAYAQILPGATQVSIVANVGYQLRGLMGAITATVSYLLPAVSLIILFSALYFHYAYASSQLTSHLSGLVAALSGVIIANAYKIGNKHATRGWLWGLVAAAFLAKLWLGINALLIIVLFGVGGLLVSLAQSRGANDGK